MNAKPDLPRRRAMRLRGYDYSQPGAYFVTVCVQHRKCLFGTLLNLGTVFHNIFLPLN